MTDLFARLKQRKLVQWGIAWAAFAFALLQGIDIVATRFDWPGAIERYLILALVIGFFVVLVLEWYHGERGAQRVGGTELLIIALLLAIGGGLIWRFGAAAKTPHAAQVASVATASSAITQHAGAKAAADVALPVPAASIPEKSVAVLPFENDSGNKDQQYFSDGLSGDLITTLSQFAGLKVINRDSSFQFRGSKDSIKLIAQKLGVAHLLEGSVQRQGGEVRITATLVNATDGSILWSQRYDKPYKDLFKLQDAITQSVAAALKAKLLTAPGAVVQSDRPPSGNLAAYAAYLRGVSDSGDDSEHGTREAIKDFQQAIHIDPKYAAAYARLSAEWVWLAGGFLGGVEATQAHAKARAAVDAALALDPDLSLAHQEQFGLLENVDMDWTGAEAEARRALQLAPNDARAKVNLATALATLGHVGHAVVLTRQALQVDPRSATGYSWLASYLNALGRFDEAAQAANMSIALQPATDAHRYYLASAEILRGDAAAALATARQASPGPWREITLGLALQIGPNHSAADAALQKLVVNLAGNAAYQIAEIYALRGDPDNTFKWLDRAWSNRDGGIATLLYDPFILRYRNDPRFAAFCKKVGLPTTTDATAMPLSATTTEAVHG